MEPTMNIEKWLNELKRAWEQHDVDAAVALFSDDVEYWETPFHRVNPDDLRDLWHDIHACNDTHVSCEVYARQDRRYAVLWSANWKNASGELQEKAGTYFVTLDNNDKCTYFHRTSMPKEAA